MEDKALNDKISYIPKSFFFTVRGISSEKGHSAAEVGSKSKFRLQCVVDNYMQELSWYAKVMLSLLQYAKQVGEIAQNTRKARFVELYHEVQKVVESPRCKRRALYELYISYRINDDGEEVEKTFPIYDPNVARNIMELEDLQDNAPRILCETVLQQIVNHWETHLANILRIHYAANPHSLANKVEFTYEQLKEAEQRGSLVLLFIEQLVSTALGGGIEDHLRFFKENKDFHFDFCDHFARINELKEIMYHRDVVVHCNGIASRRHCERMKGICGKDDLPQEGCEIKTDLKYVLKSWDIVYAAGCIFSYLATKLFSEKTKFKGAYGGPEYAFVLLSFDALKEGRFTAAQIMLEYALKNEIGCDCDSLLALKVNLALAYKYTGQEKKFSEIVNSRDWDSREDRYRAVISVLRGRYKDAYKLIRNICKQDPSYLNDVYDWVVYDELRKDPMFESEMSKIKGFKSFIPRNGHRPFLDIHAKPENVKECLTKFFQSIIREKS